MDSRASGVQSVGDFIHKEKVAKRKHKAIDQLSTGSRSRQKAEGSRVSQPVNSSSPLLNEVEYTAGYKQQEQALGQQEQKARTHTQRVNQEIDQYMHGLIAAGLLNEQFQAWFAKCIHTLGLQSVNIIVLNVRNTTHCKEPQRLLAWKLKGAMTLHYKQVYEEGVYDSEQG